jgi:hypothetical protein
MYSPSNVDKPPVTDRSGEVGAPDGLPGMVPTVAVIPELRIYSITYCDNIDRGPEKNWYHLHSLWRDDKGTARWTDLTQSANRKVSNKEGIKNPFAYVDTTRNVEIVLWNSNFFPVSNDPDQAAPRGDVWDHFHSRSESLIDAENLTNVAGVEDRATAGVDTQAVGYYSPADDTHHVIFIGFRHYPWADMHELYWTGTSRVQYGGNLSDSASAAGAWALGSAFIGSQGFNIVLYYNFFGIYSLYWKGNNRPGFDALSKVAGTPQPAIYRFTPRYTPDPVGFYTPHNDTTQVVYRGNDDHLYELFWRGVETVQGRDLTERANAPSATYSVCNFSAFYSAHTNTNHAIYVTDTDLHLHDISWTPVGGIPQHIDLTTTLNAPLARGRPASFATDWDKTNHVVYRGNDNHIYELIW